MAWVSVAGTVLQFHRLGGTFATNYYVKFYAAGTSTAINMATDNTGSTLLDKARYGTDGTLETDGGSKFIPHLDQNCKFTIYQSSTDADSNSNPVISIDNISPAASSTLTTSVSVEYQNGSDAAASVFTLADFTYTLGNNNLSVYRNGQRLRAGASFDYTESSNTTVTLTFTPNDNDLFAFVRGETNATTSLSANNVSYLPSGTNAVTTNVRTKLREFVSPQDFGALADGVTNDATAIQRAINSASNIEVFFPPGDYLVSSSITIPSNTKLRAIGKVTLKFTGTLFTLTGDISSFPSSSTFISDVGFYGLTFENTDTFPVTSSTAIDAKSFEDLIIEDCHAVECHLIQCGIQHDTFVSTGTNPMNAYSIDDDDAMNKRLKVVNCTSYVATQQTGGEYSILPNYVVDAYIAGNSVEGTGIAANAVNASESVGGEVGYYRMHKHHSYVGNTIKRARAGIFVGLGDGCTISGNTVETMHDVGIDFEGCINCVATGNTTKNCRNGGLATFLVGQGNMFVANKVVVNKTSDSESYTNISLFGGSGYTFSGSSDWLSMIVQDNIFEYYDESPSGTVKQLRVNLVPQFSHIKFSNNTLKNTVVRTSDTGSTVKAEIKGNHFYYDITPDESAVFCRPVSTLQYVDGQVGWIIEDNEIANASGSTTGTVAIQTQFDSTDTLNDFQVSVQNNKVFNFAIWLSIIGSLVRPNNTGLYIRNNYADGSFSNTHEILGPLIFWGENWTRSGAPFNSGDEVEDYGYMKEGSHYRISSPAPGGYAERIITATGFNNTDGARANNTAYALGDRVNPVADATKVWLCIVAGTSAGSEPSAGAGDFTDGTCTWREFDNCTIKGANQVNALHVSLEDYGAVENEDVTTILQQLIDDYASTGATIYWYKTYRLSRSSGNNYGVLFPGTGHWQIVGNGVIDCRATEQTAGYGVGCIAWQGTTTFNSLVIDGLEFEGGNAGTNCDALWINSKASHFALKNCSFDISSGSSKLRHAFVHVDYGGGNELGPHLYIQNCNIVQCSDTAIILSNTDAAVIENCRIKDNGGWGVEIGQSGDRSFAGTALNGTSSNYQVRGCIIEGNDGGLLVVNARHGSVQGDFEGNDGFSGSRSDAGTAIKAHLDFTGTGTSGGGDFAGGYVMPGCTFSGDQLNIKGRTGTTSGGALHKDGNPCILTNSTDYPVYAPFERYQTTVTTKIGQETTLVLTSVSGTFVSGETVTDGTTGAEIRVTSWTSGTSTLVGTWQNTGSAEALFATTNGVTGGTSGATGTISTVTLGGTAGVITLPHFVTAQVLDNTIADNTTGEHVTTRFSLDHQGLVVTAAGVEDASGATDSNYQWYLRNVTDGGVKGIIQATGDSWGFGSIGGFEWLHHLIVFAQQADGDDYAIFLRNRSGGSEDLTGFATYILTKVNFR